MSHNVSGTDPLGNGASNAGVFLGLCRFCGGNIRSSMKFCRGCGKEITAGVLVPAPSGITDPLAPSATKVFPDSGSEKQRLVEARLSLVNPYGDWGKLICDDSKEKMWTTQKKEFHHEGSWGYAGNTFCIESLGYREAVFSIYDSLISDFAYQVYVKCFGKVPYAGLLFRCGESAFYKFYISPCPKRKKVSAGLIVNLLNIEGRIKSYNEISVYGDISSDGVLLGVVAQEEKIDLYINLVHIGSVEDTSISRGNVGLWAHCTEKVIFSHAKVWKM